MTRAPASSARSSSLVGDHFDEGLDPSLSGGVDELGQCGAIGDAPTMMSSASAPAPQRSIDLRRVDDEVFAQDRAALCRRAPPRRSASEPSNHFWSVSTLTIVAPALS